MVNSSIEKMPGDDDGPLDYYSSLKSVQFLREQKSIDDLLSNLEPDTIGRMHQLRFLIMVHIVIYTSQLLIQTAAVRFNSRAFFIGLYLPILLNLLVSLALAALELQLFYFYSAIAVIDLVVCSFIIKFLT